MQNESTTDVYVGSTLGELGCWVDPSVTRMIQTGVQQSWIPDLGTYMELGESQCDEIFPSFDSFHSRSDEPTILLLHTDGSAPVASTWSR